MWEISLFQLLLLYRSLPIHRDEILLRCSASLAKSSFCILLWQSGQARGGVERDLWTWQSRLWHARRTKSYARPPASSFTPSDSPGTQKWDQNKLQLENSAVIQYFFVVKYKIRSRQIKKISYFILYFNIPMSLGTEASFLTWLSWSLLSLASAISRVRHTSGSLTYDSFPLLLFPSMLG